MSFIETLMETAAADTDVLRSLDEQGDVFTVARDVDFLLRVPTAEKADLIASFFNDYSFGQARSMQSEDGYCVQVLVTTAVTQNVILSICGFVACVAKLFDVEYDGWGCVAQAAT